MAVNAKDGSRHHSAGRAKLHDQMMADKGSKATTEHSEGTPGGKSGADGTDGKGDGEDVSHMPIHEVVAKHGPAHEVHVEHDHENGTHKVTSHHGKKKHTSEHESAYAAHDHGAMAAGVESPDEETETPDDANASMGGEAAEEEHEHAGIPGIG